MYVLSTITSTENNSLPIIEPYFLSLFGHHSSLATVGIMTNVCLHFFFRFLIFFKEHLFSSQPGHALSHFCWENVAFRSLLLSGNLP